MRKKCLENVNLTGHNHGKKKKKIGKEASHIIDEVLLVDGGT